MPFTFKLSAIDLYPEVMNIYGDRGNVLYFKYRAGLYEIDVNIRNCSIGEGFDPEIVDIIFIGGGQDAEQMLIYKDFMDIKKRLLKEALEKDRIMLSICGGFQLLCDYYKTADSRTIEGISIFKGYTEAKTPRLTGNIATIFEDTGSVIVGFENHGGRTYLEKGQKCFMKVLCGYGNNGEDKTEGAKTGNFFGTYLHGSLLPKNFTFCDYLINTAVKNRYMISLGDIAAKKGINIDNTFEINARKDIKGLRHWTTATVV